MGYAAWKTQIGHWKSLAQTGYLGAHTLTGCEGVLLEQIGYYDAIVLVGYGGASVIIG